MNDGTTVIAYSLAALAGIFFVKGIELLTKEGGDVNHGSCEKSHCNA